MRLRSDSGFGLVLLVAVIAVSGVVLYASARQLENTARRTQLRIDQAKAHYLAQAGVYRAVWDWYVSDTTTDISRRWSPTNVTVTGNMLFKAGMDASGNRLQSNYAYYTSTSDSSASPQLVKNVGTTVNATANTSIAVTVPAAGVALGNYLVVSLAMDANRLDPTCVDSDGNTYTRHEQAAATATANDVRLALFSAPVTNALESGDAITCSWTSNCTAEAMTVAEYANIIAFDASTSASATSGTLPDSGLITTSYGNELLVGAIATEGPPADSFTVGTDYLANPPTRVGSTGTGAAAVTIAPEYKVVTSVGDYSADATITNRGWAAAVAGFRPIDRWTTSGANRRLTQWQIYNINNGNSITLTHMKVSWTGGGAARLNEIRLNNTAVWSGTGTTGTTFDINDTVINNGGSIGGVNTWLQWNNSGPADPVTVVAQFIWSGNGSTADGTSHEVILWNGSQAGGGLQTRKTFTVVSTGQVNQTTARYFKVLKTVKTVISGAPGANALEIVDWDEGEKNIP